MFGLAVVVNTLVGRIVEGAPPRSYPKAPSKVPLIPLARRWFPPRLPWGTPPPSGWQSLEAESEQTPATYALEVHQGDLYAGGSGGARCWDPDEETWQWLNAGFAEPRWLSQPYVIDLASEAEALYAVTANMGPANLYRMEAAGFWAPQPDAPPHIRRLSPADDRLYTGGKSGVHVYDPVADGWQTVGEAPPMTSALAFDGATLLAGTPDGAVWCYGAMGDVWTPATPPLPLGYVRDIRRHGVYLYLGGQGGLYRCWTESGIWDEEAVCELIEPETGYPADLIPLKLHEDEAGILRIGTAHGVRRFDAALDQWSSMDSGLTGSDGTGLTVMDLINYGGALLCGTIGGVYRYAGE